MKPGIFLGVEAIVDCGQFPIIPKIVSDAIYFSGLFDDELEDLFNFMEREGIKFFSPGGSYLRRLCALLNIHHDRENGNLDADSSSNPFDKIYQSKKQFIGKMYELYFPIFLARHQITLYPDAKRKITEWDKSECQIGVFSTHYEQYDMDLLISIMQSSVENVRSLFKYVFSTRQPYPVQLYKSLPFSSCVASALYIVSEYPGIIGGFGDPWQKILMNRGNEDRHHLDFSEYHSVISSLDDLEIRI